VNVEVRTNSMHVAIVNAVYPPEPVVSARLGQDLAEQLTLNAHQVTVICPYPSRPAGIRYTGWYDEEATTKSVVVRRVRSRLAPESRLVGRMHESWSFGRAACRALAGLESVDVVYANTWPILSQWYISNFCYRRQIPLVLHIQDLYPESLLNRMGPGIARLIGPALMQLERITVRKAKHLVVVSERMQRDVIRTRKINAKKVTFVPNWVDCRPFETVAPRGEACRRYGVRDDLFTFLYFGNIGPVAGVELVIQAFARAALSDAQLVIAGDGSQKAICMDLVRAEGIGGVFFISEPRAERIPQIQQLGHVSLLPVRRGAATSSIPSKLMTYMLGGSPVIATVDTESDTAAMIHAAGGGWVGPPEDVCWLAETMKSVKKMPEEELVMLGALNATYGKHNFSKESGAGRLMDVILSSQERTT
jgi:glycosyltransferase involved in cell wall biosynthesis